MDTTRRVKREEFAQSCPQGLTDIDVSRILVKHFWKWMRGQTLSVCDGRSYNHATKEYEQTECHECPHGAIVYPWDMERYLARWPVID